jgi:hypothetical protein
MLVCALDQEHTPMRPKSYCTIEGCDLPTKAYDMCGKHYARWCRSGDASDEALLRKSANGAAKKFLENALEQQTDDCILWPYSKRNDGYAEINDNGKTNRVHKIVCEKIHGLKPVPKAESAHSCGIRHCINYRHLSWKTRSENQMDRVLHGTSNRGERQWNNKLTESEALEIKKLPHINSEEVGARYGVAARTIRDIWNNKTWSWLSLPTASSTT